MDLYLKIIKPSDFKHEQLKNQKTSELYSLSDLISKNIGSNQLFFHHDIIPPNLKSSGSHRHTIIEEVVYIAKGSVTVVTDDNQTVLYAGSVVYFDPNEKENHYIINHTDQTAETLTFSISSEFDRVIYDNQNDKEISLPEFSFNEFLREVPNSVDEWSQFIKGLKDKLKIETHETHRLMFFEYLGVANRILNNLDESEYYLKKALTLSYKHPKQSKLVQNLIRLAHIYQWKKNFEKAAALFEQAWSVLLELPKTELLLASYHQHLGKFYFDQKLFSLAQAEFETALSIRQSMNAPNDQIDSSMNSLRRVLALRGKIESVVRVRRALIKDAEGIHNAHMTSIQRVCSKDHSQEEIAVWGHRPFNKTQREISIKNDLVLVAEKNSRIEGYGHIRLSEKDNLKQAHIFGLYLTPEVVGMLVGQTIIDIMLEQCRYHGVDKVTLESTITAKTFYKKMGFEEDGSEMTVEISGQPIRCYPMKLFLKKPVANYVPEIIETERLVLRKISESDIQAIFEYCSDPNVAMHTTWEPHKNVDDSVKLVEYAKNNYQRGLCEPLAITLKSNPEILIGTVGWFWNSEKHQSIEIAYALSPKYWGQGVVVEACRGLINYAVNNFKIHRITSRCRPENTASSRVMEKLGMKHEGTQTKLMFVKGQYIDLSNYCILKEDWGKK